MKPSHLSSCLGITALILSTSACEHGPSVPAYDGEGVARNEDSARGAYGPRPGVTTGETDPGATDVSLIRDEAGEYLADARGRALYLFAADVPGANESACNDACAAKWPAFDVMDVTVDDGLRVSDFERFQRADGAWQLTFKGRPLYYFAMDGDTGEVSGDGASGKWFVARNYSVFLGVKEGLVPEGARAEKPFLTNRAGRTAYVFLKDIPARDSDPDPACNDTCLMSWPVWSAPDPLSGLILPSTLDRTDFGWFDHAPSGRQLTYRGWPLYYLAQDDRPGETSGHNMAAWRAIDPTSFALDIASAP